jgi:hypothetical protein
VAWKVANLSFLRMSFCRNVVIDVNSVTELKDARSGGSLRIKEVLKMAGM